MLNLAEASGTCLRLVEGGRVTAVVSAETLQEAGDVMGRPFVRQILPEITDERVSLFLAKLSYRAEFVRDVRHVQEFARDSKDEPYLDLAIAAGAEFLVTRDKDLLELNHEHSEQGKQFRQRHQNRLRIVTPEEFLGAMKSDKAVD